MCVEFSSCRILLCSITAPYETHTRNSSRFVDIREMLPSTKEEKETELKKISEGVCRRRGSNPGSLAIATVRATLGFTIRFTVNNFFQLFTLKHLHNAAPAVRMLEDDDL